MIPSVLCCPAISGTCGHGKGSKLRCCIPAAVGEHSLLGIPWESTLSSAMRCFVLLTTAWLCIQIYSRCIKQSVKEHDRSKSSPKHLQSLELVHLECLWLWILNLQPLGEMSFVSAKVCRPESCVTGLCFVNSCWCDNCFFLSLLSWVDSYFLREYLVFGHKGVGFFFLVDCFLVSLWACENEVHVCIHSVLYQGTGNLKEPETLFFFSKTKCYRNVSTGRICYLRLMSWCLQGHFWSQY